VIRYRRPESFYLYGGNLSRNENLALLLRWLFSSYITLSISRG
jgi:hypothetical protein